MTLGLLGRKIGMTQVNDDKARRIPVTALEVGPCLVMQKKTDERDGYSALKIAFGDRRPKGTSKPMLAQFEKLNSKPKSFIREFRVPSEKLGEYEAGKEITLDQLFVDGQFIDVVGRSKGRGFSGVMKRWHMAGGSRTHGTHEAFRHGGSIGNCTTPGRVYLGKHMAGRLGGQKTTTQNLRIVKVLPEKNCILVEGCVPGANNGYIEVRPAAKKPAPAPKN